MFKKSTKPEIITVTNDMVDNTEKIKVEVIKTDTENIEIIKTVPVETKDEANQKSNSKIVGNIYFNGYRNSSTKEVKEKDNNGKSKG